MRTATIPSLGGGLLSGSNIVRIVYMDEAGRGNVNDEPHFVVACAITHPDTQWHSLRRHYVDLANDVFDLRGGNALDEYVFHAKDVWHGSNDFSRSKFSLQERMNILERLSQIPALYDVPICVSIIDRKKLAEKCSNLTVSMSPKGIRVFEHAYTYAIALQYVDSWMQENCPSEVALVTAEDTNEVKEAVGYFHEGAKKTDTYDDFYDRGLFVTRSIVDTVNFAPKETSPLLQIADHCAFLAKRFSVGCRHSAVAWSNIFPKVWKENKHFDSQIIIKVPVTKITL